jgi:hypothetical protein
MNCRKTKALYHYTNADALMGILKKDNIYMWATRYCKLNDSLEFTWGQKHILPKIKQPFDKEHRCYPYIISFCKHSDNLTMWRLYGNDGLGFQLVFDYNMVSNEAHRNCLKQNEIKIGDKMPTEKKPTPGYFMHCVYATEDNMRNKVDEIYKIFSECHESDANNDILDMCTFIKRIDYEVEGEIRYVRPNYDCLHCTKDLCETDDWVENKDNVKYRLRGKELVPYQEILFDKEALKEIVVGYRHNFEYAEKYLKHLFTENEYDSIKITPSKFTL